MTVKNGDKLYINRSMALSDDTRGTYLKRFLIISVEENKDAIALSKAEGISIRTIFGLNEFGDGREGFLMEQYMVEGSPLHTTVLKCKLGVWASYSILSKQLYPNGNQKEAMKPINRIYIQVQSITRANPLTYEIIMKKIDPKWITYSNSRDNLTESDIPMFDEQIMLTIAHYLGKGKNMDAMTLIHRIYNGWSYIRVLNVIQDIKKKRLSQTYGYLKVV